MTGEPRNLSALIRWYSEAVGDAIPTRLHSRQMSEGGTPEWHAAFRAWLLAHPAATAREGYIRSPLRYWLWVLHRNGGRDKRRAEFLWRLAYADGDDMDAVHGRLSMSEWGQDMAEAYAIASLRILWRMMQSEPVKFERGPSTVVDQGKSESQHRAEEAA